MRKLLSLAAMVTVSLSACAELAHEEARAPMPVLADERPASRSTFDYPDYVPADKVIKDGETSGKRHGETWVCANPECTIAQRERSSPPPHAQDKPRQF